MFRKKERAGGRGGLTHSLLTLVNRHSITARILREGLEGVTGDDRGDREQEKHERERGAQGEESVEVEHYSELWWL